MNRVLDQWGVTIQCKIGISFSLWQFTTYTSELQCVLQSLLLWITTTYFYTLLGDILSHFIGTILHICGMSYCAYLARSLSCLLCILWMLLSSTESTRVRTYARMCFSLRFKGLVTNYTLSNVTWYNINFFTTTHMLGPVLLVSVRNVLVTTTTWLQQHVAVESVVLL